MVCIFFYEYYAEMLDWRSQEHSCDYVSETLLATYLKDSPDTQSTDTSPTCNLPPSPASASFIALYIVFVPYLSEPTKAHSPWQSQWRSGKESSYLPKKKSSQRSSYLPIEIVLTRGFLLIARGIKLLYNRTLAIECKVSRVFCILLLNFVLYDR